MLSFDFQNVFKVGEHGLTKKPDLVRLRESAGEHYSFYDLPKNVVLEKEILKFARAARERFDHFVLLGIGGSALGARCIADALTSHEERARLIVLDNIDPSLIEDATAHVDLRKTLFLVISKSGETAETLAQYFYFRKKMDDLFGQHSKQHFVFVTDPEKGFLRKVAREEGIQSFEIPPDVGGRFSVLSVVGLLPAALIGVDISALMTGAAKAHEGIYKTSFQENHAYQLAILQYFLQRDRSVSMTVLMPYCSRLATFSEWYAQLLAESIGKEKNVHGEMVHVGLTPIKALGVTDQHSQIQLYTSGPYDKFVVFLEVEKLEEPTASLKIPACHKKERDFSYLHDISFYELLLAEKMATEQALTQYGRPNATIRITKLDPFHLGVLFMFFQDSIAFLGELYEINVFDQPGVELGKVLTKKILSES